jgi:hypothetical protein
MPTSRKPKAFSDELEGWIHGQKAKTLESLIDLFEDRSFAVLMLLLMLFPALPIPTAGHVFEAIVALIALEQIAGLKAIWLPRFLTSRVKLEKLMTGKLVAAMLRRVRWLEARSSPRWSGLFNFPLIDRFIGLVVLGFAAAAFFAPPLSGLDTLPSLGVVIISLGVIIGDAAMLLAGIVIGTIGVTLSLFLGAVIVRLFSHLF